MSYTTLFLRVLGLVRDLFEVYYFMLYDVLVRLHHFVWISPSLWFCDSLGDRIRVLKVLAPLSLCPCHIQSWSGIKFVTLSFVLKSTGMKIGPTPLLIHIRTYQLLCLNLGVFRFHLIYSDKFLLKINSKINEIERSRGFALSHITVSRLLLIALEMNLSCSV